MPRGISLHCGLNHIDPAHYAGWDGRLQACEADANSMESVARSRGFEEVNKLLSAEATYQAVSDAVTDASQKLAPGDLFFFTYAGHGGQVFDANGDEPDGRDETLCLFDGQIIDDELFHLYSMFSEGVRILIVSDSCHSGSNYRARALSPNSVLASKNAAMAAADAENNTSPEQDLRYRFMPREIARKTFIENRTIYTDRANAVPPASIQDFAPQLRLLSACQDDEYALDGMLNGLFTSRLLQVWEDGQFTGNYDDFHQSILSKMPSRQRPKHSRHGPISPDYDAQVPFTIT